jgi:hypothetical protein
MSAITKWSTSKILLCLSIAIGICIVASILGITIYVSLSSSFVDKTASLALLLGSSIMVCGYYHLVYVLPKMAKSMETQISIEALRVSFWLVIFGLVIIVLGLLHLMGILPPTMSSI